MFVDKQLELSDAQAETTVAAHDSTNYIDMGAIGDANRPLYAVIQVAAAVTSGGAATVQFKIISDSDSGFATTPVTHYDSGAIGKATLVAGYRVVAMPLPIGVQRYLKVTYTIATAVLTAGSFDAFLTPDVQTNENPA